MLERLLELIFHAKSGVFAAVFLLGTTGALVTATVSTSNGVTTITLTETSPSPSVSPSISPSTSPSPSGTASTSPSVSPSTSPSPSGTASTSPSPTPDNCAAEAHAINAAVQTVDRAFSADKHELASLERGVKTAEQRKAFNDANKLLASIRQAAVKAIHATRTCADNKHDDEDVDEQDNDDNDKDKQNEQDNDENDNDGEHGDNQSNHQSPDRRVVVVVVTTASPSPSASPSNGVTFNGTDPKAIADRAVAAMTLVVNTAKTQIPAAALATPKATPKVSPKPTRSPEHQVMDSNKRGSGNKDDGKRGEHGD